MNTSTQTILRLSHLTKLCWLIGFGSILDLNAAAPSAPVAKAASAITASGFMANWNASTGATGYRLDVATDNAFRNLVAGYADLNVNNTLSRAVAGLIANTQYYYRVRAYNATGPSPNSATINAKTLALSASGAGLVHYYPMNAGIGLTVADAVVGGFDGTFNSAKDDTDWVPGVSGKPDDFAVRFVPDSSREGVLFGADESFGNASEGTVMMWVKQNSSDPEGRVFQKGDDSGYTFLSVMAGNRFVFESQNGTGNLSQPGQPVGEWFHVAVSWSVVGNVKNLYINGVQVGSGGFGAPFNSTPSKPFAIGADPNVNIGRVFDGVIDELKLFNGFMTASEVNVERFNTTPPIGAIIQITQQPQDASVDVGQTAMFSVAAQVTGANPADLRYLWQKSDDGGATYSNIQGATATSYTTPATTADDNRDRFRCVLSLPDGTMVVSREAILTVAAFRGLIHYYRMNEGSGTAVLDAVFGGIDGSFNTAKDDSDWVPGVSGKPGDFAVQFVPDNSREGVLFGADASFENASEGTVMMWVKQNNADPEGRVFQKGDDSGYTFLSVMAGNTFVFESQNGTGNLNNPGQPVGVWFHVAVSWSVVGNVKNLYINGVQVGSGGFGAPFNSTPSKPFAIGADPNVNIGRVFDGVIDELKIFNTFMTAEQVATARLDTMPPIGGVIQITQQPQDQTVEGGRTATFSVAAAVTGANPADLRYQWQKSDDGGATFSDIAGATATSHTTSATTSDDNQDRYRCVVSLPDMTRAQTRAAILTVVPRRGLVHYYPMNAGFGTAVADAVPGGFNGTFNSAKDDSDWVLGVTGVPGDFAVRFVPDNRNEGVLFGSDASFENASEGTIMMWLKQSNSDPEGRVFQKGTDDSGYTFLCVMAGNTFVFESQNGTGNLNHPGQPVGKWFHVAVSWSVAQNVKNLYVNGALVGSGGFGVPFNSHLNQAFVIGADPGVNIGRVFDGVIDELKLFNKFMTDAEVASERFNTSPPFPPAPVHYYPMNAGLGTIVADAVPGGFDGTFNSAKDDTDWVPGVTGDPSDFAVRFVPDSRHEGVRFGTDASFENGAEGTVMLWLKQNSADPEGRVFQKGDDGSGYTFLSVMAGNQFVFESQNGTGNLRRQGLPVGEWVHVAVSWTVAGNVKNLYVNGAQVDSGGFDRPFLPNGRPFAIGADPDVNIGRVFDGVIDEVKLYNKFLSAEAVDSERLATTAPLPRLFIVRVGSSVKLYWRAGGAGLLLKQTLSLSLPDWTTVTEPPNQEGSWNVVTLAIGAENRYFRLQSP